MSIKNTQDIFWRKVIKSKECWVRQGCTTKGGYHMLRWNGKNEYGHRVVWEILNGNIMKGFYVLHKCDNRACVRPDHLFLGTQKDNVRDMITKGRRGYTGLKGEKHPDHKLFTAQVIEIRDIVRNKKITQKEIANKFNITQGHVAKIINYKVWNNL